MEIIVEIVTVSPKFQLVIPKDVRRYSEYSNWAEIQGAIHPNSKRSLNTDAIKVAVGLRITQRQSNDSGFG
jgi:hypothetical protein